ncbi:MAG TPA: ABC transporter permease, partial [Nitrolancea sp.]|nr:ABC transporter permease [Nitrolancea sp.]
MGRYIIRRLLQSILVVVGVTFLVFIILYQTGDPVQLLVGPDATKDDIAQIRHQMGFDRPWYVQYADFLSSAARGDFGRSLRQDQPVWDLIVERLPATLELAVAAFLLSLVISLPVGIIS